LATPKTAKTVTAIRAAGRGRVRVELDGEAWRTLPLEAIVSAGIAEGVVLDRPCLRTLAREVRRARALGVAGRALTRRDLSEHGVRERLARAGVAPAGTDDAVGTLRDAGIVDDERFALARALALAERGRGDAAIRFDLERHGIAGEALEAALAALEPEQERAERIVARRGGGPATARYLARRGFGDDAVEAAADAAIAPEA
jgi:SOS response regulatory protein OraA/RecX